MSPAEVDKLCYAMLQEFPEIVSRVKIGESYQGRNLYVYIFMNKINTSVEKELKSRPGIFINGAHHARELTSISMVTYIMLKFLHSWVAKDQNLLAEMVENRSILYFLPIVNIDAVTYMAEKYIETGIIPKTRKNMHNYSKVKCNNQP